MTKRWQTFLLVLLLSPASVYAVRPVDPKFEESSRRAVEAINDIRMSRVYNRLWDTSWVVLNGVTAVWAWNTAGISPRAKTRDFGRVMTGFFAVRAVWKFGEVVLE